MVLSNGAAFAADDEGVVLNPPAATVHDLFAEQTARTPSATAMVFGRRALSYREVNRHADVFAQGLLRLGLSAENLVAICAERSPEQLIAALGTLKAGAAYASLDPAYPNDRLTALLADARPVVLVTHSQLLPRLSGFQGPVICLDTIDAAAIEPPVHSRVDDRQLAYVIFTSGSAGKPKGVLIEHRSLANHARAVARHYELGPEDRVLQFASLSFDVAAEEIYPTWLAGGTVVLWPVTTGVAPVRHFIEFVEEQEITVLNLPAPYWHEWVDELSRFGIPSKVRLVITGSDKVSSEKFSVWRRHAGSRVRFCAAYGPTEATITATIFDPAADFVPTTSCLPIGLPIDNVEAHVFDGELREVAPGETGELFIGGAGLARGYLNHPELSADKFVDHRMSNSPRVRLYRTGDLARRLPDGNLEFLGRSDDQLKIRGYRIEVEEIQNVLKQHPGARDVLVIGRENASGNKQLVAYIVAGAERPATQELRDFVKARLPEYMVPSAFVMLKYMPLTPGGKIDRRELPTPEFERDSADKAYVAPRTEIERQLVAIWEALLDVRPIGIRDNFFEIGGHSLLDVRLVAEIERRIGVTLPLGTIYFTRNVENLALRVERRRAEKGDSLLQPYRTTGTKPPLFSQGGSTYFAEYLGADQPIYLLDHHGTGGLFAPDTIEKMAASYVAEIRAVQPRGPYYLNGYCIGGVIMLEVARQLGAEGEEIRLLSLIDPITPRNMPAVQKPIDAVKPAPRRGFVRSLFGRIKGRYRWLERVAKRVVCDLWLRAGRRLPVYWRDFYCNDKLDQALLRYAPAAYPGSILLFRQPNNGTREGWQDLAEGEIDFEETWVDHNEMLEEPYVQIVAARVKSSLERAQNVVSQCGHDKVLRSEISRPFVCEQIQPDRGWIMAMLTLVSTVV